MGTTYDLRNESEISIIKSMILGGLDYKSPVSLKELVPLLPKTTNCFTIPFAIEDLRNDGKIAVYYRLYDEQGNVGDEEYEDLDLLFKEKDLHWFPMTYLRKI